LHRVIKASPDKVYRAFLDPDAQCKWLPPYGFTAKMHQFEPNVGGKFKMSFTNFTTQETHSFGGSFLEIEPGKRICYTDVFDDPNLPGELTVTIDFTAVVCGTDVRILQEGVPEVIPEAACYVGWQESLAQLALLVEPDLRQ
jgi:uncharacterized protein YndB with AHSA1/START domain